MKYFQFTGKREQFDSIAKKILIMICLFFITAPSFAQNPLSFFGPYFTLSDKKAKKLTASYYTKKKEKCNLKVNDGKLSYVKKEKKGKFHNFTLKTEPGKKYNLTVESMNPEMNGHKGILTIPAQAGFKFAAFGNTINAYPEFEKMCSIVNNHQPSFFVHTGNMTPDSMSMSEWQKFFNYGSKLFSSTVFLPVVGGLDFYSTLWEKLFDVSNKRFPFYSYELPSCTLIVLNSGMYTGKDSTQYIWLVEELKKAQGKWKIVIFHHAPFSTTQNKNNPILAGINNNLIPLLETYKVDLVINGMDNLYEHSLKNGVTYITAGGASEIPDTPGGENPYRQKVFYAASSFVIFDVKPETITISAYDIQNQPVESFQLKK
jgi:hypothetical protein